MKKLIRLLVVLALPLIVLLIAGAVFIDDIAETAIEEGGGYALGVQTEVADAHIGLFSGGFGLEGLTIANPPGFDGEHVLSLGTARLDVSLGSLRGAVIRVPELRLEDVALDVEYGPNGSNLGPLLESLKRFESGEAPSEDDESTPPAPDGEERRFIIDEIAIRNVGATVKVTLPTGEQVIPLKLPEIHLQDVGASEGGQTVPELTGTLLKALVAGVKEQGKDLLPEGLLNDLEGRLGELQAVGAEMAQGAVDDAKKQLEKEAAKHGLPTGNLGEQADEALDKGLKGLLGGDKK